MRIKSKKHTFIVAVIAVLMISVTLLSACTVAGGDSAGSINSVNQFSLTQSETVAQSETVGQNSIEMASSSVPQENSNSHAETTKAIKIEKVEAVGTNQLVVTLDGEVTNFDKNDIKLQAYNSDWYSLSPKLSDRITIKNSRVEAKNGKTTITYDINEKINADGTLESSFATPNLSDSEKSTLIRKATNAIDWQLSNGGWGKNYDTTKTFDGYPSDYCWQVGGEFVGTIDNEGTYTEMRLIAEAYALTKDAIFKNSFLKGYAFIKKLQYSSGGFSQIYPHNGNYNDNVTLNDDAMCSVVIMLEEMADARYPFADIITKEDREQCQTMVDKAVEYLLNSQIVLNGKKTGWCAQHNPTNYKPVKARSYELASISGQESVSAAMVLLNQRDNSAAIEAAKATIEWFESNKIVNQTYDKADEPNFFSEKQGSVIWYRFYNLTDGRGYFCTRDGKVCYTVEDFYKADCKYAQDKLGKKTDRTTGYNWAGDWAKDLLNVYNEHGYFADKIVVSIVTNNSTSVNGKLTIGNKATVHVSQD